MNIVVYSILIVNMLLYIFYMIRLPENMYDQLDKLFMSLAILNFINSAFLCIMGFIFVNKMTNVYQKFVLIEAAAFIWG